MLYSICAPIISPKNFHSTKLVYSHVAYACFDTNRLGAGPFIQVQSPTEFGGGAFVFVLKPQ